MQNSIYNAVTFNLAWLVCVLSGSTIAVPVTLFVVAVHLIFMSSDRSEIALIAVVVLLGVVVDSLLIRSGLLLPPDGSLWPPLWLVSLWGLFATTLNHSLRWFQRHIGVAVILGGIAGTLTYLAGTRLTDFSLREPQMITLAVMFVLWSVVFPFCVMLTRSVLVAEARGSI